MPREHNAYRAIAIAFVFASVIGLQFAYDDVKPASLPGTAGSFSPGAVRIFDFGFHSTAASFIWIPTMPEILDMLHGRTEYLTDEAYVNAVDPKLSYPYAFSVLTLPAITTYPAALTDSVSIGQAGLANADADWRISYYMATNYYLYLKDTKDAQLYYDIAARTPGVPGFAKRFALNFGIGANQRQQTEELWETIRDSTNDQFTKDRAQAYIDRLEIFDYLDAASKAYKQKYGVYPTTPQDLVTKGIIPEVPQDPLGFTFVINKDGTSGIDTTQLPPGFSSALQ